MTSHPTTEDLIWMVERHIQTLEEVATAYALGLKNTLGTVDWTAVNGAIIRCHSVFFLKAAKHRAWKIVEEAEARSIGRHGP